MTSQGGRGKGASLPAVTRALIPLVKAPPLRPNHLPMAPPPHTIFWELGFNLRILGRRRCATAAPLVTEMGLALPLKVEVTGTFPDQLPPDASPLPWTFSPFVSSLPYLRLQYLGPLQLLFGLRHTCETLLICTYLGAKPG